MDYCGAVIDLDGTVYRGKTLIPGTLEAIDTLRDHDISLLFLTNNPTQTREAYTEHLDAMGLHVTPEEILSAGTVTTRYLVTNHDDDRVFVIGSSGLCEQFERAGIEMTDDPDTADVVVTSYDYGFDYETLTEGLWALRRAHTFIGTDPDLIYPGNDGRPFPGSGAITTAVGGVAKREPDIVLGKPATETVEVALEALDHQPEECLAIGDRPSTDIAFGNRAGMTTVLVLSGVTKRTDLETVDPQPDHVIETIGEVPSILGV